MEFGGGLLLMGTDIAGTVLALFGDVSAYLQAARENGDLTRLAEAWWTGLRWATIYAAIVIFISSADDAFLDIYFWVLSAQNLLTRPFRKVPSMDELRDKPRKRLAIMVPAWQEADVIAQMLDNTIRTMAYDHFDIFVGVYQNDPDTRREVDKVAAREPRVFRADVRSNGPTSKADCLNWIVLNIFAREAEAEIQYDGFLLHDAEDVIHPHSLQVTNWYLDGSDMLQLPVLSMPRPWTALVACVYMDEFAEWHGKDLVARTAMTQLVPSAGVATAFSRDAMKLLYEERDRQPFNTDSLTEDYDIGHRFYEAGLKSAFVRYFARVQVSERRAVLADKWVPRYRRELVCTREFFPDSVKTSARQKSRWMLGISFLGWKQLGWLGDPAHRYFLYRDRKAIWSAPTGMLAYAIVFNLVLYQIFAWLFPEAAVLPELISQDSWIWALILVNFGFLVNRVVHRLLFTGTTHGLKYAMLAPVRMVLANYIGFLAVMRAGRQFTLHLITGKPITWDKTAHTYPSIAELQSAFHAKGPAMAYAPSGASAALAPATPFTPLEQRIITPEGRSADELARAAQLPRIDLDPLRVSADIRNRVPVAQLRAMTALPYGIEIDTLLLAVARPLTPAQLTDIEASHGGPVRQAIAPASDIGFGLAFSADSPGLGEDIRAARVLTRFGLLAPNQAELVWRRIRRDWSRTVEDPAQPPVQPPFGFIRMAQSMGFLSAEDLTLLRSEHAELLEDA